MTNWQKEVIEFVSKNEGHYGALVLRAIKYPSTVRQGKAMMEKMAGRGEIEVRGGRYYKATPTVVKQRTFEWKPLVHSLMAPFQRPVYDAPGCVIRSRMNTNESEVLA